MSCFHPTEPHQCLQVLLRDLLRISEYKVSTSEPTTEEIAY